MEFGDSTLPSEALLLNHFRQAWAEFDTAELSAFIQSAQLPEQISTLRELVVEDVRQRLSRGREVHFPKYLREYPELSLSSAETDAWLADVHAEFLDAGLANWWHSIRAEFPNLVGPFSDQAVSERTHASNSLSAGQ